MASISIADNASGSPQTINSIVADADGKLTMQVPVTSVNNGQVLKVTYIFDATTGCAPPVTGVNPYTLRTDDTVMLNVSSIPLAIKLSDITAENKGKVNEVSWTTVQEDAGDRFQLQRSSNGNSFNTIATINGKGRTAAIAIQTHRC